MQPTILKPSSQRGFVLAALTLSIDSSLLSVAIYQSKPEAHIFSSQNLNFHTDGLIHGNWGRTAKLIIMFAYINACFSLAWFLRIFLIR